MRSKLILASLILSFALAPMAALAQSHAVVVTWTASPDFKSGWSYSVYKGTAPGNETSTPIATGITALTYTDSNVQAGDVVVYGVVTVSSAGGKSSMVESAGCTVPIAGVGSVSCKAN